MEYIVYVKINENKYITDVNSSAFLTDITGWVEIDRGYGDKYHHAQGNYFEKSIYTNSDVYRYKLVDGKSVECTAEEIRKQEQSSILTEPTPTLEDRVTALEQTVNTTVVEYNQVLQELGVET